MIRRAVIAALLAPLAALAQPRQLWFDPTQLPTFTGTVERYLPNPRGEVDGLLFREGPQIVFPPQIAAEVRRVVAPGRPIVVWGIRARSAPVITMLAWAPDDRTEPTMVDRPAWGFGFDAFEAQQDIQAAGKVRMPLLTSRGEVAGAILENGTVLRIAPAVAARLGDRIRPGADVAVRGRGVETEHGIAIAVQLLGPAPDRMEPLPQGG
jgi:hypothetical protein